MTTIRKTESKAKKEKSSITKDDSPSTTKRSQDDKLKKNIFTVSTPRNYSQKSTTADIYGKIKGGVQSVNAPRKLASASSKTSNVSPMKDLLKSSSSSVSQVSRKSVDTNARRLSQKKVETKATSSKTAKKETPRKLPFVNVTVNSPIVKRKLNLELENVKEVSKEEKEIELKKDNAERQRTKTRTLHEDEVKVLTPDAVDNNAEMLNLSRKLIAKPKAFYIDLDAEQSSSKARKDKSSDEDVSYEDDFESYESDFESYHSESQSSDQSEQIEDDDEEAGVRDADKEMEADESNSKEVKDEERMLDSGSFDLRDQRSANKAKPAVMDFILEGSEGTRDDKKISLTDEGFQEMSSSSAVSSMKTVHVEVLDRPLFIDFTKSKENKRKRRMNENLKQRAKDLLAMITLHEMSYSLFEMKPFSYDLYMVTFGRSNYMQTAVQTFDDGVSQEVQTDEVAYKHKWTQNPVQFSNSDVYLNTDDLSKKSNKSNEDFLTKFTFLIKQNNDDEINNKINADLNYKSNPLRVYLEQKDGVGSGEMLPYGNYKSKINNNEYNSIRLRKFLKKFESRISSVLSTNTGSSETTDLVKTKYPFSRGFVVTLSTNNASHEKLSVLKYSKITQVYFSETKSNLLMTVHLKVQKINERKCIICLWDVSITRCDPIKILVAIDDVKIARFRGNSDGIFVAALEDRSIHLWDLSEEATWRGTTTNDKNTDLVNISSEQHTQMEKDREWNLKNSNVGCEMSQIECALQACAFTSSASNVCNSDVTDCIVGLELSGEAITMRQEGRRILGQVIALQRIGILTIWLIIQEKSKTNQHDIGKAFWSKLKLERSQTIPLLQHYDVTTKDIIQCNNFNLNAAKRRLSKRKSERSLIKEIIRPKTAVSKFEFDSDIPASARRRMLQADKIVTKNWENGLVCNDMKVMRLNNEDNYLVAKNSGEVLCCRRSLGAVKVNKFCVASDSSSVTCLEISSHGLPYFLAATDSETVNLCSLKENRVLLTLDCRNGPQSQETERCNADHKGRYVSSVSVRSPNHSLSGAQMTTRICVSALVWSRVNPCYIFTLLRAGAVVVWDLTCSDIYAKCVSDKAAVACAAADSMLALLTPEGEVQLHRLTDEQRTKEHLILFEKYVALL